MSDLPPELLVEILVRLRHKDILLCLCVCKVWNATIDDQQFIKTHLQRSIQTKPFRSILVSRTLIRWPYPMGSSYCFYDDNIGSGGEKALRQAWASAYIWGHFNVLIFIRTFREFIHIISCFRTVL
ncbi:hypothetical protein ACFX15_025483 [Malus domestica]